MDRTGDPLALNGTLYEIGVVPEQMEGQKEQTIKGLSSALGISEEQINKSLNAAWVQPGYFVPIKKCHQMTRQHWIKCLPLKVW